LTLGGCLSLWLENARYSWSSLVVNSTFAVIAINYHMTGYTVIS